MGRRLEAPSAGLRRSPNVRVPEPTEGRDLLGIRKSTSGNQAIRKIAGGLQSFHKNEYEPGSFESHVKSHQLSKMFATLLYLLSPAATFSPSGCTTVGSMQVVRIFSAVSVLCFIVGLAVQDWSLPENRSTPTGGPYDKTWGTYVTDYLLGIECAVMAAIAPGGGLIKQSIVAAHAASAVSWGGGGLLHHLFYTDSLVHRTLWLVGLLLNGAAGVLRLYAAILTAQVGGKCSWCPNPQSLSIPFGGALAALFVTVPLSQTKYIPIPDFVLSGVTQLLADLCSVMIGYSAGQPLWASGLLATVLGYFGLNVVKFSPFKESICFNDNGLFHSAMILCFAMSFGLLTALVQAGRTVHH